MSPAVVLWGVVALGLLVLGATVYRTARSPHGQTPPFRRDVPWIIGGVLAVGGFLVVIHAVPSIVIAGVMAYTGIAATAIWRMASLDGASPWMAQSRRLARFGIAAVALTWLGLVFGLLLWIADMVANALQGLSAVQRWLGRAFEACPASDTLRALAEGGDEMAGAAGTGRAQW